MLPVNGLRILVATKPVDFRKGHDGLAALVSNDFGRASVFRYRLHLPLQACGSFEAVVLGRLRVGDDLQAIGGP